MVDRCSESITKRQDNLLYILTAQSNVLWQGCFPFMPWHLEQMQNVDHEVEDIILCTVRHQIKNVET